MANALSKDSKVVVHDSDVKLETASVNNTNQGTKVEDLSFVKIVSSAPTTGVTGQLFYSTDTNKLYICVATNDFEITPTAAAFVAD